MVCEISIEIDRTSGWFTFTTNHYLFNNANFEIPIDPTSWKPRHLRLLKSVGYAGRIFVEGLYDIIGVGDSVIIGDKSFTIQPSIIDEVTFNWLWTNLRDSYGFDGIRLVDSSNQNKAVEIY